MVNVAAAPGGPTDGLPYPRDGSNTSVFSASSHAHDASTPTVEAKKLVHKTLEREERSQV